MNELVVLKKKIEIIKWLDLMGVKNFKINDNLTVDVDGSVSLHRKGLNTIPIQFGYVDGNFHCQGNDLITLKGCPLVLEYDLNCDNNLLLTLEHAPKKPYSYKRNPCTPIYDKFDWMDAHEQCRKAFDI